MGKKSSLLMLSSKQKRYGLDMCGFIKFVVFVFVLECTCLGIKAKPVAVQNSTKSYTSQFDPLTNMGNIALKIVEHIANAKEEEVDLGKLSEFVTALSEATVIVKHPEIPQLESVQDEVNVVEKRLADEAIERKETDRQLEENLQATQDLVVKLQAELNKTRDQLQQFKVKTETRQNPVGFTASATTSQTFVSSSMVKFDKVTLHYGDDYDPNVGLFTCPVTGLYLVSVKVDEYSTNGLLLEVVVAGLRILYLYDTTASSTQHMSTSGSVLAKCQQGNRIWVQSTGSGRIYGQSEANVFSVFLLSNLET